MKNSTLPCEIVKDLLPSYVENLTSEKTNDEIDKHLLECDNCKNSLESMTKYEESKRTFENRKEIDYLKKTKKRNTKNIIFVVLAALIVCSSLSLYIFFMSGTYTMDYPFSEYELNVEGNSVTLTATSAEDAYINKVSIDEENGTVNIKVAMQDFVLTGQKGVKKSESFKNKIKEVYLNDSLIWKDGNKIDRITRELFELKTPYVGGVGGNEDYEVALNLNRFGGCYNKLQTTKEPYGWTFVFPENQPKTREKLLKETFTGYGYALLAIVDNLGYMSFEYKLDGKKEVLTVTKEEATKFAGENIKEVGKDILKLQKLAEKSKITVESEPCFVHVWNYVEDISELTLHVYNEGKPVGTFTTEVYIEEYNSIDGIKHTFRIFPEDLNLNSFENTFLAIKATGKDKNGNEIIKDTGMISYDYHNETNMYWIYKDGRDGKIYFAQDF